MTQTIHFRNIEQQIFPFQYSGAFLLGESGYARKGQILITYTFQNKTHFLRYRCPST